MRICRSDAPTMPSGSARQTLGALRSCNWRTGDEGRPAGRFSQSFAACLSRLCCIATERCGGAARICPKSVATRSRHQMLDHTFAAGRLYVQDHR
jgi:hypothetical protein